MDRNAESRLVENAVEKFKGITLSLLSEYQEGLTTEDELIKSIFYSLTNLEISLKSARGIAHFCPAHNRKLFRAIIGEGKTTWMCPADHCGYSKELPS